jgi:hypothetical protein
MLTTTYSLVAISAEQKNARSILSRLKQYIQHSWKGLQGLDLAGVETAFNKLRQFDRYFHTRKVEVYVIPALRGATREADPLLAELDSLSSLGVTLLRSVQEQLRQAFDKGRAQLHELCNSLELYCDNLLKRLAKEEEELLPLVRRVLSIEEWFDIGAKFLSEDEENIKRKRTEPALPTLPDPI